MAPPSWSTVTVNGTILDYDGEPASGFIEFATSDFLLNTVDGHTVTNQPISIALDSLGQFSVVLLATDTVGIEPAGWRWRIRERLTDRPEREFYASLPLAVPVVNYSDLVASGEFNEFS